MRKFVHKNETTDRADIHRRNEATKDWRDRITAVCTKMQWSLSEFCRFAKVDVAIISRVINKAAPSDETIKRVEKALQKAEKK